MNRLLFPLCSGFAATPRAEAFAFNARSMGVKGDGITDDTQALQAVLDACAGNGGGVVQLPRGSYVVREYLTIPEHVMLQGVFGGPSAASEEKGTVILAYAGRGDEDGTPFLTMKTGAGIRGVCIRYPEQTGSEIVPYPWCIAGDGEDISIVDCLLENPYQGIDVGSRQSHRHFISRVYGYPLRRGIFVDQCFDIGRIENVHLWPFWRTCEDSRRVRQFVQEHGEAFIFAMTDWQYVFNTFCWGYRYGYRFTENGRGVCNGNFVGIGADACGASVLVDNCAAYGLLITNGEFVALYGEHPTQIVVGPENSGSVQFSNCAFWGPSRQCVRVEGKGYVSLSQCHFLEWDSQEGVSPGVDVRSGTVNIYGCRFAKGAQSVRLGRAVRGAVITGNLFAVENAVHVEEGATATVAANGIEAAPVESVAGSRVIGVLGPNVRLKGEWWDYAGRGTHLGVAYFCVYVDTIASFTWHLGAETPGQYTLSVWAPKWVTPARGEGRALYRVYHADGETEVEVLQSKHSQSWVPLGHYALNNSSCVVLENMPGSTVIADSLLVTPLAHAAGGHTGGPRRS